jgi:hypothetical protein
MKGLRLYNSTTATTNDAIGIWFATGPHQAGIASFRADAGGGWETTIAFYTHVTTTTNLNDATEKMRITGDGELLINTTSDAGNYKLQVSGNVYATAYFESSDIRLKNVISSKNSTTFGTIQYKWKDGRDDKTHWGYSAQEVMKWIPDALQQNTDGYYTLDYHQAHAYKIGLLEERIIELESIIQQLKNK